MVVCVVDVFEVVEVGDYDVDLIVEMCGMCEFGVYGFFELVLVCEVG